MLINSTIHTIYQQYFGGKTDLLDRADRYSEAKKVLDNDEWRSVVGTIIGLYANAGYYATKLAACDIITLTNGDIDEVIDCNRLVTDKDASLSILEALQKQSRYASAEDKVAAIMADMSEEYKIDKDIDHLVAKFVTGAWQNGDVYQSSMTKTKKYLQSISHSKIANISQVYRMLAGGLE